MQSDAFSPERQQSNASEIGRIQFAPSPPRRESSLSAAPPTEPDGGSPRLRHRRSSLSMAIGSLRTMGGPNSLDNFARSWQRAAGFTSIQVQHARRSSVDQDDDDLEQGHPANIRRAADDYHRPQRRSLLREQLLRSGSGPEVAVDADEGSGPDASLRRIDDSDGLSPRQSSSYQETSIFEVAPYLATPLGSYGATHTTSAERQHAETALRAGEMFKEQQTNRAQGLSSHEAEPLLVRRVQQEDGKYVNIIVGQSTLPQTVFNSINVLVGIGLLAIPNGLKYSGLLIGTSFLTLAALVTSYTAKLLARCLDAHPASATFSDIAYWAFGPKARLVVGLVFSLELTAACVALIILLADSLDGLFPGYGVVAWKITSAIVLIPLSFVPLRILSFTSIIGVLACFGIISLILLDGLLKRRSPGSLWDPCPIFVFPADWRTLPGSFGLLMSPWGGHSVFPQIYGDMRHRKKYGRSLITSFSIVYAFDMAIGITGILMFGENVKNEVTANILSGGYPSAVSICIAACIAIICLSKIPLNSGPIFLTLEVLLGLDPRVLSDSPSLIGISGWNRGIIKASIRTTVTIIFIILACLFPDFERIMAFMGSALCLTICVILPVAFNLKIMGNSIGRGERALCWALGLLASALAIIGTVWSLLPSSYTGIERS